MHSKTVKIVLDISQRLVTSSLGSSNTMVLLGTLQPEEEDLRSFETSGTTHPMTSCHISKHLKRLATPQGEP